MATAPTPRPHAAATTETRVCFHAKWVMAVNRNPSDDACSVRLHGDLILSHASRKLGPNGWFVNVADPVVMKLDHQVKVYDPSVFQCIEVCSELIYRMLAEAPATRGCDLAANNWTDPRFTPHNIAMEIVQSVGREIDEIVATVGDRAVVPAVPGYDVVIEIPKLCVSLLYTEPKEPAADTVAARVSARRRKSRHEPAGELCAICFLDLFEAEEEEEEAVRLPCSHPFHSGCIAPWFHRASTCPTCRRDIFSAS